MSDQRASDGQQDVPDDTMTVEVDPSAVLVSQQPDRSSDLVAVSQLGEPSEATKPTPTVIDARLAIPPRGRSAAPRPILPAWVKSWSAFLDATSWWLRHTVHVGAFHGIRLPALLAAAGGSGTGRSGPHHRRAVAVVDRSGRPSRPVGDEDSRQRSGRVHPADRAAPRHGPHPTAGHGRRRSCRSGWPLGWSSRRHHSPSSPRPPPACSRSWASSAARPTGRSPPVRSTPRPCLA